MKLQKLVYLAYGWWLAYKDDPLLSQKPEVWQYGPVFNSLYSHLNIYGHNPIKHTQKMPLDTEPDIDDWDVCEFLDWICIRHQHLSAAELSDMTHKKGSPWQKIAEENNYRVSHHHVMEDQVIREYYLNLKRVMTEG